MDLKPPTPFKKCSLDRASEKSGSIKLGVQTAESSVQAQSQAGCQAGARVTVGRLCVASDDVQGSAERCLEDSVGERVGWSVWVGATEDGQ